MTKHDKERNDMLQQITENVWVHESECLQSNSVIVKGNSGVLLIDAGLTTNEMHSIAEDLSSRGLSVSVGFSTHPHWDHVLWDAKFGDVPRYGTETAFTLMQAQLSNTNWKAEEEAELPEEIAGQVPLDDLFGKITALPHGTINLPWDGPEVTIIEHAGHSPGHAALVIKDEGVLVAGDMLSDVFIPMLNVATDDPINNYLAALQKFEDHINEVKFVVPGHGSIGKNGDVGLRLKQDRTYVQSLRDGDEINDARITSPKKGWDWVAGIHEWQLKTLADKKASVENL